jgi:hypothetical protein
LFLLLRVGSAKPIQIPYPVSIAFVLFGCALVFSLIAFVKGGPSSVLAAIAKSGFTAAFTLIFVSEIGDKVIYYYYQDFMFFSFYILNIVLNPFF